MGREREDDLMRAALSRDRCVEFEVEEFPDAHAGGPQ